MVGVHPDRVLIALIIDITFIGLLTRQGIDGTAVVSSPSALLGIHLGGDLRFPQHIDGDSQGDFGADYPGYTYEETVEATPLGGYLKYTLTVKWGGEEGPLETKIISFITSR